ncbi:SigE family RNA polymerase sigma factor [Cellulosimicrobium protaetiae]|uniref:SigE family RNA polymerase sigma factor n=1 Tax=Cellulosimicrobium protaetiae TaxID=2587808 RepID=A0A6M5UMZ1_9MICO|nr:SigE family RNA polymerase sigma factor [Cellulosimicrobium protaetiae]
MDASPGGCIDVVVTKADRDAEFVAFVDRHGQGLHRLALFLAGDRYRAEELLQTTLERTYRSWSRARAGDPAMYARRVLSNARIDSWRRARPTVLLTEEAVHAGLGARGDASDELGVRDELVRALRQLPVRQRRVVVLRHLLDLSEAETAAELGVPVGTVKSASARGIARLRTILGDLRSHDTDRRSVDTAMEGEQG